MVTKECDRAYIIIADYADIMTIILPHHHTDYGYSTSKDIYTFKDQQYARDISWANLNARHNMNKTAETAEIMKTTSNKECTQYYPVNKKDDATWKNMEVCRKIWIEEREKQKHLNVYLSITKKHHDQNNSKQCLFFLWSIIMFRIYNCI